MDVVSELTTDEFSYEKLRIRTVAQYGDHPLRAHKCHEEYSHGPLGFRLFDKISFVTRNCRDENSNS